MATAIQAAAQHGEAELWVWHSSRLARGDGTKGRRSIALVVAQLLYENVRVRSVSDDPFVTPMLAGIGSETAHKYSEDLSAHTRRGLRQRKAKGLRVGPIPLGYTFEYDGPRTRRVIDPATRLIVERIFAVVESGDSFGQVSRALNAEGVRTKRHGTWVIRTVRELVRNDAYAGRKGYPAIIDPGRFDAIQAGLRRLDPAALQRRSGGRKPADPSFWLQGVAFCLTCGASLYSRTQAIGRAYVCANRRQRTGLCHAEPIPADVIEGHVLAHLEAFVGDAETWLAQQAAVRDDDHERLLQTAHRHRDELAILDHRRDLVLADYERALSEGDPKARLVLEVAGRLDRERSVLQYRLADAEAVIAEWEESGRHRPKRHVDLVRALSQADTHDALNRAMAKALAGIHARIEHGRLRAEFALRAPDGVPYLLRPAHPVAPTAERITLPDDPGPTAGLAAPPAEPCASPSQTRARSATACRHDAGAPAALCALLL